MKIEAPQFRIIDNEPGWGSFVIQITTKGALTETEQIQAIEFPVGNNFREYYSDFSDNRPVRAARFGKRGMCGIQLNPDFQVTDYTIARRGGSRERIRTKIRDLKKPGDDILFQTVEGEISKKLHMIDSTDTMKIGRVPNAVIRGQFLGKQMQITVSYKPNS